MGQVLRVIKSNCPRTVAAIDEAAGTWCLPLALPDQVGNFHFAPLEVRQDEAWGQGRGEREKTLDFTARNVQPTHLAACRIVRVPVAELLITVEMGKLHARCKATWVRSTS